MLHYSPSNDHPRFNFGSLGGESHVSPLGYYRTYGLTLEMTMYAKAIHNKQIEIYEETDVNNSRGTNNNQYQKAANC